MYQSTPQTLKLSPDCIKVRCFVPRVERPGHVFFSCPKVFSVCLSIVFVIISYNLSPDCIKIRFFMPRVKRSGMLFFVFSEPLFVYMLSSLTFVIAFDL